MKIEEEIHQKEFKSPFQKATINLLFTANWLSNYHKSHFKPYGITSQQYNVLRILRGSFPKTISTSDIKKRMIDKNSDASRIIDRLSLKGLVHKANCPSDRRLVDLKISDKGLELLTEIDTQVVELEKSLGGLSVDEAEQLSLLLDKLRG